MKLARQFAVVGKSFGWSHEDMMRLSPAKIMAYHGEIRAMQAADELRLLETVRVAYHGDADAVRDLRSALLREATGRAERLVTITNNEELKLLFPGGLG